MNWFLEDAMETYAGESKKALKNMLETTIIGLCVLTGLHLALTKTLPPLGLVLGYLLFLVILFSVALAFKIKKRKDINKLRGS